MSMSKKIIILSSIIISIMLIISTLMYNRNRSTKLHDILNINSNNEIEEIINNENKFSIDIEAPVASLIGTSVIYVNVGSEYIEPGISAYDYVDEDVSDNYITINEVNTDKAGKYSIIYKVSDLSSNNAYLKRTVIVQDIEEVKEGNLIYLTFDDGPSIYTNRLLDILNQYNVKATFFVVGSNNNKEILNRIVNEGHTIGLHSNTHVYSDIYKDSDSFFKDLDTLSNKVYDATSVYTNIIRFPGGTNNNVSNNYSPGIMNEIADKATSYGYIYFDWNVDSFDVSIHDSSTITTKTIDQLRYNRSNIILFHDTKEYSIDSVESIIQYGLNNNFTFEKLDNSSKKIQFNPK